LYTVVYLKPKQLIIKDCVRRFVLKLYRHEASHGLFATAELLVLVCIKIFNDIIFFKIVINSLPRLLMR